METIKTDLTKIDNYYEVYKLKYNNEDYIFKYNVPMYKLHDRDSLDRSYLEYMDVEIIISNLIRYVGIPCIKPKIVNINNRIGIIEENVLEKGYEFFNLYQLLELYYDSLNLNSDNKKDYISKNMNNLLTIKDALLFYFKDIEIVEELFISIVKIFSFDYITMQKDRSLGNIMILFNENEVKLAKLFDNEEAFMEKETYQMKVIPDSDDILNDFLDNMDVRYISIFLEIYEKLNMDNLAMSIVRSELENSSIDYKFKNNIINSYENNYENIRKKVYSITK